jgi:hypothetical protein
LVKDFAFVSNSYEGRIESKAHKGGKMQIIGKKKGTSENRRKNGQSIEKKKPFGDLSAYKMFRGEGIQYTRERISAQ